MLRKTKRYTRHTYGDSGVFGKRNVVSTSFAATDVGAIANASTTALQASTVITEAGETITLNTELDAPRAITLTLGGTAGDISGDDIVVNGENAEGATISETFDVTVNTAETLTGTKAFAKVTTVVVPAQDGAAAELAIGTSNLIGIGQRTASTSAIKVLVIDGSTATVEDASATSLSTSAVESNTVTLDTSPDGSKQFRIYVLNYAWHVDPTNAQPAYGV